MRAPIPGTALSSLIAPTTAPSPSKGTFGDPAVGLQHVPFGEMHFNPCQGSEAGLLGLLPG